jgi:hypothetical protein
VFSPLSSSRKYVEVALDDCVLCSPPLIKAPQCRITSPLLLQLRASAFDSKSSYTTSSCSFLFRNGSKTVYVCMLYSPLHIKAPQFRITSPILHQNHTSTLLPKVCREARYVSACSDNRKKNPTCWRPFALRQHDQI